MKDKVVIVTGASSGIGLACARLFSNCQSKVVIAARRMEILEEITSEIIQEGGNCFPVKTDVTIESDCEHLIKSTVEKYGGIDVLINNAGISMRASLEKVDLDALKKVMDVNFWGTVYCTKYALPFIQKTQGSIVGISSIAGFHGLPGRSGYAASKFAMHGFLESVRIENRKNGVHVMVLAAGFTSSNIRKNALNAHGEPQGETPLKENKLTSPEKVAKNVYRGIQKRKRNRIMSAEGQLLVFFQRILPEVADLVIYKMFAKEPNSPF